jgi:hypothetical protein
LCIISMVCERLNKCLCYVARKANEGLFNKFNCLNLSRPVLTNARRRLAPRLHEAGAVSAALWIREKASCYAVALLLIWCHNYGRSCTPLIRSAKANFAPALIGRGRNLNRAVDCNMSVSNQLCTLPGSFRSADDAVAHKSKSLQTRFC